MSLFIGGVGPDARTKDLQELFGTHGRLTRCDIKGNFGFVTFEDERDAEDAISAVDGKTLLGQRINVEWARGSGRFDPNRSNYRSARFEGPKCYSCGERGHFARNCRNSRGRRSRSRSRDRRSRSRSRSPRRRDRRSRSRSRDRKSRSRSRDRRSRSRSPRRDSRKNTSSPKNDNRDRSRSPDRKENGNNADTNGKRSRSRSPPRSPANGNE